MICWTGVLILVFKFLIDVLGVNAIILMFKGQSQELKIMCLVLIFAWMAYVFIISEMNLVILNPFDDDYVDNDYVDLTNTESTVQHLGSSDPPQTQLLMI